MSPTNPCGDGEYRDRLLGDCTPCRLVCDPRFKTEQECKDLCYDTWKRMTTVASTSLTETTASLRTQGTHKDPDDDVITKFTAIVIACVAVLLLIGACLVFIPKIKKIISASDRRSTPSTSASTTPTDSEMSLMKSDVNLDGIPFGNLESGPPNSQLTSTLVLR
ncbi:hypothetical protein CAPTEDRAFT_221743 [Capitella teleta]|uniref:Uncharacterized protein n=1 Tax=Capitella teleta TaxID=283909 RepID=R7VM49_CAPTE|nr:hypothetical protein CAPTEDRAFT_221743 [Capitella teleta]|eukprot:ELU18220.1 hypothetical protein CAPTEDRAFT_221743 [Capitella teleta]